MVDFFCRMSSTRLRMRVPIPYFWMRQQTSRPKTLQKRSTSSDETEFKIKIFKNNKTNWNLSDTHMQSDLCSIVIKWAIKLDICGNTGKHCENTNFEEQRSYWEKYGWVRRCNSSEKINRNQHNVSRKSSHTF